MLWNRVGMMIMSVGEKDKVDRDRMCMRERRNNLLKRRVLLDFRGAVHSELWNETKCIWTAAKITEEFGESSWGDSETPANCRVVGASYVNIEHNLQETRSLSLWLGCLRWFRSILSAFTGSKHRYGVGRMKRWEDKHSLYIIHNHSSFLGFQVKARWPIKPWTETNVWYRNIIPGPSFILRLDLYLSAYIKLLFMFSMQNWR